MEHLLNFIYKKRGYKMPYLLKLRRLYRDNFLPDFTVELPLIKIYKKYLHIPFFFLWLYCIIAILLKKVESYTKDYIHLDWSLIAFSELFWLVYLIPFVIAVFIPLKPFVNLVCCLVTFYCYMVISSFAPFIGKWVAEHTLGHFLDLMIFVVSILLGHYWIFKKLFFIVKDGKITYSYTK